MGDLTSTRSLLDAADWIRRRATVESNPAYAVVVIRASDMVVSVDSSLTQLQLRALLEDDASALRVLMRRSGL